MMRDFERLTHRGKIRRLKALAEAALAQYPLMPKRLSLLQADRNAVFRVDTRDGNKVVIHIADPVFDGVETRSALQWLSALSEDGTISVPRPIRNHQGELLTLQSHDGVPQARICTVISWVYGVELGYNITVEDVYQWAKVIAQVHQHGKNYTPPDGFTRMTYDDVMAFPTDELVIFNDEWRTLLNTDKRFRIYQEAYGKANTAIHALYDENRQPQILHGDLNVWNVLRYYSTYSLIDFEDVMWGFPVQDIGTGLYYARHHENYAEIIAAFREGYTSILPWVENEAGQLDSMMVARFLNLYNMRLMYTDPKTYQQYEALTESGEKMMQHYLETGVIHRV